MTQSSLRAKPNSVYLGRLLNFVSKGNQSKTNLAAETAAIKSASTSAASAMRLRLERASKLGENAVRKAALNAAARQKLSICSALIAEVAHMYGFQVTIKLPDDSDLQGWDLLTGCRTARNDEDEGDAEDFVAEERQYKRLDSLNISLDSKDEGSDGEGDDQDGEDIEYPESGNEEEETEEEEHSENDQEVAEKVGRAEDKAASSVSRRRVPSSTVRPRISLSGRLSASAFAALTRPSAPATKIFPSSSSAAAAVATTSTPATSTTPTTVTAIASLGATIPLRSSQVSPAAEDSAAGNPSENPLTLVKTHECPPTGPGASVESSRPPYCRINTDNEPSLREPSSGEADVDGESIVTVTSTGTPEDEEACLGIPTILRKGTEGEPSGRSDDANAPSHKAGGPAVTASCDLPAAATTGAPAQRSQIVWREPPLAASSRAAHPADEDDADEGPSTASGSVAGSKDPERAVAAVGTRKRNLPASPPAVPTLPPSKRGRGVGVSRRDASVETATSTSTSTSASTSVPASGSAETASAPDRSGSGSKSGSGTASKGRRFGCVFGAALSDLRRNPQ